MTGRNIYLSDNALGIIERVQEEFEDEYGFRPSQSQVVEILADGTKYVGEPLKQ